MKKLREISREQAIEALARNEISIEEVREDTLARLHSFFQDNEDSALKYTWSWSQKQETLVKDAEFSPTYQKIQSSGLSDEIKKGEFLDILDSKYNEILLEWSKNDFVQWNNQELKSELERIGQNFEQITGEIKLFACPCCGADTLTERHGWDICPVCWREDDGRDNINASYSYVGPDVGLHLYVQRINFLKYGISEPKRRDLVEIKEPIEKYSRSRFFEIDDNRKIIFEKNTNWYAPLTPPSFDERISQLRKLPTMELAMVISRSYFCRINLDFSCLWPVLHQKLANDAIPPTLEEIAELKKSVDSSPLLREKFKEIFESNY